MSNHIGDTNKMVSETPRTDAHIEDLRRNPQVSGCDSTLDFSRQLERELNAANIEIEEKRKDVVWLATEKAKLEDRIKRLEEAGDAMALHHNPYTLLNWQEAKEAKL